MAAETVDVVVLTRPGDAIPQETLLALRAQQGVSVMVHRVVGAPLPTDRTRYETIARARNQAHHVGTSPWMMFVDDDIVLPPVAIRRLLDAMAERPAYGALGVNVRNEPCRWTLSSHVGMGATLFRRSALNRIRFRAKEGFCECSLACHDLRRLDIGIGYVEGISSIHRRGSVDREPPAPKPAEREERRRDGKILVAFNRRHYDRFVRGFLASLRRWGNRETVLVVGYGLYPSELRRLRAMPGIEALNLPVNGVMPPVRRLLDFQPLLAALPEETPTAYWDAGDVLFQANLQPLWKLVRRNPDKLLAVREPRGYPDNAAVAAWTLSVRDPAFRRRAFDAISAAPFLNSGFAAGTARSLLAYFREAHRTLHGPELFGTSDWGDQIALNLYCHTEPERWLEAEQGWNYCVHDRPRGMFRALPDGTMVSSDGTPIYAAHGNARSLRKFAILH